MANTSRAGSHEDPCGSLYFQPLLRLWPEKCLFAGAEALRSRPAALHGLSKDQLFELDLAAIKEAGRAVASWPATGVTPLIAVNAFWSYLANPEFASRVIASLSEANLNADQLIIELLETDPPLLEDPVVLRTLEELTATGVRFALDDVGGPGSYSTTKKLDQVLKVLGAHIYEVKVAREALQGNEALAIRLVELAVLRYGIRLVVFEGIENEEHLDWVRQIAVVLSGYEVDVLVQGFYFLPKQPLPQLCEFIKITSGPTPR